MALAILRAVECRELAALPACLAFEQPILDLGCGDGLFGQVFFEALLTEDAPAVGLDYSMRELSTAAKRGSYSSLVRADISKEPFPDNSFATVFSNGVLEHVRGLGGGLQEIARVLRPAGRLVFTVPTMEAELQLSGASLLRGLGLSTLSRRYAEAYNRVFGQINVHPVEEWRDLLADNGLRLVHHRAYGSPILFRLHDLLLPFSVPNFLCKRLTGRWSVLTGLRRVTLALFWAAILRRVYLDESSAGGSLLMVAEPTKTG